MRDWDAKKICPLLKKEIYVGGCIEVQEVRDDNMDMELFYDDPFDLNEAQSTCEKCKWYLDTTTEQ